MSINKKKLELKPGKSAKLKAKISSLSQNKRYNAKKDNYTYESANTKVATVNKYGRVKAVGKGRTLIYVTSKKTGCPEPVSYNFQYLFPLLRHM